MATIPYFFFSPSMVMSLVGLMKGADKTGQTADENWRQAKVDIGPVKNRQLAVPQMILRLTLITCALGWLVAIPAAAQPVVPGTGLVAEGDRRWDSAVSIYREALDREPTRADLWIRIADIEATRGNTAALVDALQHAARIRLSDPAVLVRLSQAYSVTGQPRAAVEAIEAAFALSPDNEHILEARGELATWSGQYDRAQDSYRRLRRLRTSDTTVALRLARVSAWSGDTNEACAMYREYLAEHFDDGEVWIELARTETRRGNYAAALDSLDEYEALYGNTAEYRAELAAVLARAGKAISAIDLVDPLIYANPDSPSLHVTRPIARAMDQPEFGPEAEIATLPPALRRTREVAHPLAGLGASSNTAGCRPQQSLHAAGKV